MIEKRLINLNSSTSSCVFRFWLSVNFWNSSTQYCQSYDLLCSRLFRYFSVAAVGGGGETMRIRTSKIKKIKKKRTTTMRRVSGVPVQILYGKWRNTVVGGGSGDRLGACARALTFIITISCSLTSPPGPGVIACGPSPQCDVGRGGVRWRVQNIIIVKEKK